MRPLKHIKQIAAFDHPSRFKFLLTGRRGGKTTFMREDILRSLPVCPDKGEIYYIGPTNMQAIELIWEELEDRIDQLGWKCSPKISKQRFEFSRGRKIYVIGAEKIRRIRGHKVYRAYMDELAFFETPLDKVWRAVRPALSDLRGHCIVATTPDGKGTPAYDFYLQVIKNPEWKYFHWHTLDNPYIDPEEIEAAKRDMDEKSFKQEYLATWESFEGLAYYCFDEGTHLGSCAEIDESHPLGLCLDFNVNPTSLLLVQKQGDFSFWRKEYSQKNSSTLDTMKSFCEDFKDRKDRLHLEIYGDSTGHNRKSTTGRTDYFYVQEMLAHYGFHYQMKVPAMNPPIVDRVAYVNAWLRNVKGESRIQIDPGCSDLIKDLSGQVLEGRFPSDKGNLGHKADAFGYFISWHQLQGARGAQRSIQL